MLCIIGLLKKWKMDGSKLVFKAKTTFFAGKIDL